MSCCIYNHNLNSFSDINKASEFHRKMSNLVQYEDFKKL